MTTKEKPEPATRVELTESLKNPEKSVDYQFLLEENLALIRDKNKVLGELVKAKEDLASVKRTLQEEMDKNKSPGGYRGIRRSVIWLNIFLSIGVLLAGPVLWLRFGAHPGVNAVALAGVIWMITVCTWLDGLANNERY